jgi:hypothetical protein
VKIAFSFFLLGPYVGILRSGSISVSFIFIETHNDLIINEPTTYSMSLILTEERISFSSTYVFIQSVKHTQYL